MAESPRSSPEVRPRTPRPTALLPPAIVLALAILGSLSVHLPIYAGLGALRSLLDEHPPRPPAEPVELTILEDAQPSEVPTEAAPDAPATSVEPDEAPPEPDPAPRPRRERARRPPPEPTPAPRETPPEPEPQPPPVVVEEQHHEPPPPPPELDERRAIVQRSEDPEAQPDDAQFIADQANDVEEQTVASITNTQQDQPDPTAASPRESAQEAEGDSDEEVAADLRDVEGDDRRVATPIETERRPTRAATDPSTSPTPSAVGGESLDPGADSSSRRGPRERSAEGGARATGGGERAVDEIVVSDGFGTFTIRRPREDATIGEGEGEAGGRRVDGRGRGDRGAGALAGAAGRTRGGAREGGSEGRSGRVQLGLSWAQLEAVYGEEELRREREARLEERRSHARGGARRAQWEQFRAAIENYVPEVRPGNQTALDAAASPFATFLSDMHRRIHREFADRYLAGLGMDAAEGLNDQSLQATLEISVNPDGTIHRVGIVATSGNILFDYGAFAAVMRAQPFPRPPGAILSGDGHAWLHWRFDRGPRQCGTWNARPFMLDNAPLVDRGEPPEREEGGAPAREDEPVLVPSMPGIGEDG